MPKILVVDDEPSALRDMTRLLTMHGFEAVCVADGLAAVVAAQEHRPALVVMDVTLEGSAIDGWECTRRLKANPCTSAIPVIAVTGWGEMKQQAREAGCDDLVAKPVNHAELIAKIRSYLPA